MDRNNYPKEWEAFSLSIRRDRATYRCECEGECGLHGPSMFKPGTRRCVEINGQPAKWARGVIMLTVAHLNANGGVCACEPLCANPAHVKAMCQRCHLRYDLDRHVTNRVAKRDIERLKRSMFPTLQPNEKSESGHGQ